MLKQSGNVLFIILIAVALFAALSYAVVGSSRNTGGNIDDENTHLIASEILNYVSSVETAFTRLRARGCDI